MTRAWSAVSASSRRVALFLVADSITVFKHTSKSWLQSSPGGGPSGTNKPATLDLLMQR